MTNAFIRPETAVRASTAAVAATIVSSDRRMAALREDETMSASYGRRRAAGRILAAALACAACGMATGAARAEPAVDADYPCPSDLRPLRDGPGPSFGLVSLLFPPLLVAEALARDPLSEEKRFETTISVAPGEGRAGPVRIAILHEGDRHVGDLASGEKVRLPAGRWVFQAAAPATGGGVVWGRVEATVAAGKANRFEVRLDRRVDVGGALSISGLAPDGRAPAASVVRIDWTGGWHGEGRIAFGGANAGEADGVRVGADRPTEVEVPTSPGHREVRLLLCAPRLTLAKASIVIGPADVRLDAPDVVDGGSPFLVQSIGRNGLSFDVVMRDAAGEVVASRTLDLAEPSGELVAPILPGRYTLVRRAGPEDAGVDLVRRSIEVKAVPIVVTAPDRVAVGAEVEIDWTGSGGASRLELWRLGEGGRTKRIASGLKPGRVRLSAPVGRYELRVVPEGSEGRTLGRRPIEIEGQFFGAIPARVKRGERVVVALSAGPAFFDEVVLVPAGASLDTITSADGLVKEGAREVAFDAPKKAGRFELVLVSKDPGDESIVIERRGFTVE